MFWSSARMPVTATARPPVTSHMTLRELSLCPRVRCSLPNAEEPPMPGRRSTTENTRWSHLKGSRVSSEPGVGCIGMEN
eukprot:686724-Prorocentrum_minimum.AAC.1